MWKKPPKENWIQRALEESVVLCMCLNNASRKDSSKAELMVILEACGFHFIP